MSHDNMTAKKWTPETVEGDDGRPCLWLEAPTSWKIVVASSSFLMGAGIALGVWRYWAEYSSFMRVIGPPVACFLMVGSIEYLQRVYLFAPEQVRMRCLWLWRSFPLPHEVYILATPNHRIEVWDALDNRCRLRIPADYTRQGTLLGHLIAYYKQWLQVHDVV